MTTAHSSVAIPRPTQASLAMLRCRIGRGEYLLPLRQVLEIIRFVTPTPVPQTPPWVSGVMNLRGRVVPVFDLAVKFGEPAVSPDEWTCIVLVAVDLEGEATTLGLTTSLVSEIHELQPGDLEPAPSAGTQIQVEFLQGLLRLGDAYALALDLDRVLSANEKIGIAGLTGEKATP